MSIANTGEHRLNWSVKLHKRDRVVKSVANLVFARGDEVYENRTMFQGTFSDPYLYGLNSIPQFKVVCDSHKLFKH